MTFSLVKTKEKHFVFFILPHSLAEIFLRNELCLVKLHLWKCRGLCVSVCFKEKVREYPPVTLLHFAEVP